MTSLTGGGSALEYYPVHYGGSRVQFRGPRRELDSPYVAFLGGTETYGRFIETPFPILLEERISAACVNFGVVNAGIDLYLNDPAVIDIAERADAKVIQVMGAQNMSNRYYSVHPRRNDRFLRASEALEALYPEVDFTEFHFNRHMLRHLHAISEERFTTLVSELRLAWVARMKHLLTILRGRVILLWFADHDVPVGDKPKIDGQTLFVTRAMLDALRPRVTHLIEVVPSHASQMQGTKGMVFGDFDACAAEELLGPSSHDEAADILEEALVKLLQD